jgi:hypothetical protein
LARWKKDWRTAWEHDLQLPPVKAGGSDDNQLGGRVGTITREPDSEQIHVSYPVPWTNHFKYDAVVIIASIGEPNDKSARALNTAFLEKDKPGSMIFIVNATLPARDKAPDQLTNFFTTYNRTRFQNEVADLKAVAEHFRQQFHKSTPILLAGVGEAGLPALAAAPLFDGVVADCAQLDDSRDQNLLDPKIFFPGVRRIGGLQGIAALAAPHPLLLHNTAGKLEVSWLDPLYARNKERYRQSAEPLPDNEIARWILKMAKK